MPSREYQIAASLLSSDAPLQPPAMNLRVHMPGLAPEVVEEQVVRLGQDVLPRLRAHRPAAVTTGSGPPAAQRAG